MSKELFVTSTPHETKLAVVEDDQLVEVFFERENEYTLAGSIYKGKVTRVLPGMQSAFVEIGLERDAFLYVTDFLEEVESDEDEPAATAPAGEPQSEGSEVQSGRQERQTRGGRGRDRGGRDRGGRRPEQHRAAQSAELKPVEDTQEFVPSEPEGNLAEDESMASEAGSDQTQQPQPASGDRLPRRWRGRRGRRRGRSFLNESRYASSEGQQQSESAAEPDDENVETVETHGEEQAQPTQRVEQETQFTVEHDATDEHEIEARPEVQSRQRQGRRERKPEYLAERTSEHLSERTLEHSGEPVAERPRQPQRPQRILLPGESLAKYNPRPETPGAENRSDRGSEGRFQKPSPRPSTEVSVTPGSLSAGVLAGESIAKYRNRPVPVAEPREEEKTEVEAIEHTPQHRQDPSRRPEQKHEAEEPEGYDVHAAHVTAEKYRHDPAEPVPQHSPEQTEAEGQSARGEYNFSPGSGVIEEEEIVEEEHEMLPEAEESEDHEFEELEEETLEDEDDPRESHILAASEGIAAALMENRDPSKPNSYAPEEEEEEEEEEGLETDSASADVDDEEPEEEGEEVEESLTLEGGYDGPDVEEPELDPEDPNYSGRAEIRGPAATAGYQQRAERTSEKGSERGFDRGRRGGRRGGRPQRSGRPMRGGPRRNIPRGPMPQIDELLKEGQEILVQIAKEPMAKKGARITSHIALPGRFLVFMPTVNHTGVSRKIGSDEERQRLKRILISEKGASHGGFIVRTAASGASEEDLRADIRFLINLWNEIKQRAETSKAPALIYHDLNLVERILRDQVTTTFSQIWVDNENEYERILRFASRFQPSLVRRVKLYSKETPLFEEFSIQDEINKALKSKVWLKSGGYIVINQTEALVAIDINTGKYVGKTSRLEDTIVKTNIDAIKEIVRQIRLRDLGGIIVIDFIDMDERKNRQRVMQALEEALKSDRSPSKVLQFNDFGLVAITRKRVKQSLERTLGTQCTYCTGTGMIKSVATVCNEIYVELRKMTKHFDNHQITLRVNPEVAKALKENGGRWLLEMEELTKKTIIVKSDPAQHQEQFDIH